MFIVVYEKQIIKFATLEDAFMAAGAVKKAGYDDVFVSSEEDTDARYMIPKRYRE